MANAYCLKDLRWLLRRGSPLPIPNRVVKPACADGTAICGRVCRRLSLENPHHLLDGDFLFVKDSTVNMKLWGYWILYDTVLKKCVKNLCNFKITNN